jgi:hypothetical protein
VLPNQRLAVLSVVGFTQPGTLVAPAAEATTQAATQAARPTRPPHRDRTMRTSEDEGEPTDVLVDHLAVLLCAIGHYPFLVRDAGR